MRIANGGQSNVVESNGVQTTSAFNIARTPHMFNILSSGLYSDKIGAVLREVGCNAADAHIMAGTPELPIQVKLPTSLDRSFYVKDWGPGLDDHEVRELYSTYGWSSKQQRDDVTGAFGLGSKSPFAYTMQNDEDSDGFTVEAVKDGVKRIYTCYIGETGAPAISRLYEGPAEPDWQHGVKVTFPVRARDVAEFHEKAREIYRWFPVKPEVLGLNGGAIEQPEFRMRSDFFAVPKKDWSSEEKSCAVMGGVRYPIKKARLRDLEKIDEALLSAGIHLFVPMGTVMMTPSREELEYTERTRAGIKQWLHKAAVDVATRVREAIEAERQSAWSWYKNIQQYAETLPFSVSYQLPAFLATAGMDAQEAADVIGIVNAKSAKVPHWVGDGLAGPGYQFKKDPQTGDFLLDGDGRRMVDHAADYRGCRVWVYGVSSAREGTVTRREIIGGKIRVGADKYEEVKLAFASNVQAFFVDSKQADARVRGAVRDGEVTTALLVVPCKGTDLEFARKYAERLCGEGLLEGLPLHGTSTLPVPEYVAEQRERRKLMKDQSPREYFSDTEVRYMALNGKVVQTTLGELDEGDLYYMCARNFDQGRKCVMYNGTDISFGGYYRTEVMEAFKHVIEFLQLPITGVVLVDTEARVKRLKLPEQGFKPFLAEMRSVLSDKDTWAKLTAGIDRTPQVRFREMYYADDYGWLGILGHHMVTRTVFWKMFKKDPALRNLATEVVQFVSRVRAKSGSSKGNAQTSLLMLAGKVNGIDINSSELAEQNTWEVKNEFVERRPMMGALDESTLREWMNANPAKALMALRFAQAPAAQLPMPASALCQVDAEDSADDEAQVAVTA